MDFWDGRAKPAILEAVEAACSKVRQELVVELQQRDQNRHAFLTEEVERLKDAAARAVQLEKQNQQLRQELEHLRTKHQNEPPTTHSDLQVRGDVLADGETGSGKGALEGEHEKLKHEYEKLAKRYQSLDHRYAAKKQVAEKFKEDNKKWIQYVERLEKKLKRFANDGVNGVPESSATHAPPPPTESRAVESEAPALDASFRSNPESNSGPGIHEEAVEEARQARRAVSTPPDPPARLDIKGEVIQEITCDETAPGDDYDEYDVPELPALPKDYDIGGGIVIKHEPSSDDLAVVSEKVVRKRKLDDEDASRMPPPSRKIKIEQSSDPVVTGEATVFSPHESIDLDGDHDGMPTPRKARALNSQISEGEVNSATAQTTAARGDGVSEPSVVYESREEATMTAKPDRGLVTVARDGNQYQDTPEPRRPQRAPTTAPPKRGGLQSLLDCGTPMSAPPVLRALRPTDPNARRERFDTELDLMALRYGRKKPETSVKPPTIAKPRQLLDARPQTTPNQPKHGTIRKRPLAELRLDDFKINPKYNNGHTHAYDEVVRGRAERAQLEGCIDPQCCGKELRVLAQSELDNGGIAVLSRPGDVKLMESYMGDEAYRLIGMTVEDKKRVWFEAKIRDLAKKYGRHRHKFARRPSPPGFWDADFPSTQEVQKNKEEGERRERSVIEERYREAMRGGGKWLFRDE